MCMAAGKDRTKRLGAARRQQAQRDLMLVMSSSSLFFFSFFFFFPLSSSFCFLFLSFSSVDARRASYLQFAILTGMLRGYRVLKKETDKRKKKRSNEAGEMCWFRLMLEKKRREARGGPKREEKEKGKKGKQLASGRLGEGGNKNKRQEQ